MDTDSHKQACIFHSKEPLALEKGGRLPELEIAYHLYGAPPALGKPIVWVCHALTANSDVYEWWPGLFGTNALFNTDDFSIVCANVLGSPYGSTAPLSQGPGSTEPWYHTFPELTIRDMVQAHERLRQHLGIKQIHLAIGGSMGGQQVLEWAVLQPTLFQHIVVLASNAMHSAWGRAFNESQRMAIAADATWKESAPHAGKAGLAVARSVAMLSYRHYDTYAYTQVDAPHQLGNYRASSYQRYQGEKLAKRFDAFSYWHLSQAMDSHDLGRHRESAAMALAQIQAKALLIGIANDVLFPPIEQAFIAQHIPNARLEVIESLYGHDGFLIETEKIGQLIKSFLPCKSN